MGGIPGEERAREKTAGVNLRVSLEINSIFHDVVPQIANVIIRR